MDRLLKNIKKIRNTGGAQLRCLFLFYLQFFCFFLFSQKREIKFEYLGIESGLSINDVFCMLQDTRGFMWFGTSNGLNKYDGYQFTLYKNNPADQYSLTSNGITTIIEDAKKDIWVGTWGGGLNKFDREQNRFTHFKHDPKNPNSISDDFVTYLLEDKSGNLWVGGQNGGLDIFDRKNNLFIHYGNGSGNKILDNVFITTIFEDSWHNLWIGTLNGGMVLLNRKTNTFTSYLHNEKYPSSISNDVVNAIYEDSHNNLWIGTNGGGLDQLNIKTGEFKHFKSNLWRDRIFQDYDVLAITEDDKGSLWIGTRKAGLLIFDPLTGISYNYFHDDFDNSSLSRDLISGICKDSKKNIWISTNGGGINFVNNTSNGVAHYKHNPSKSSLSDNNISAICEDSDKYLWIGTQNGGLNMFDQNSGKFVHYKHDVNNKSSICGDNILSICEDKNGNLWIGTWADGITVFNRKNNTFKHFKNDPANPNSLGNNNAWVIFEDKEKSIWVGTYGGGLDMYDPDHHSFIHYQYDENKPSGINNNNVVTIYEDSKGYLWIGTDGRGLSRFDKKTKFFTHFTHDDSSNSISYNFVGSILEDREGNLYLTTGIGLDYFNTKTHHFINYAAREGFTGDGAHGILPDEKGNLWLSTKNGISSFNPSTKKFRNFSTEDGLYANIYNPHAIIKSSNGTMYFGGISGFDKFLPGNIKKVSFDPPLVITDFQVFNKEVPIAIDENDPSPLKKDITETKSIVIPYSSSVFSLEFASLHFGTKDRKQYAYMLENFDKTWNEVGARHIATYTNLDPGEYLFKVKGLTNEGNWSKKITTIQLIIKPPFWLTWWFKLAVILAITGTVIAFYLFRVNAIKDQKEKLQLQVREKTLQLVLSAEEEHKARQQAENARIETELANKELKIKNKELEQFAYVASHDLQEPLRTTTGFVELLQQKYHGQLDEKADKYLDFISDASSRMAVLIKDLLDFSRIGTNMELKVIDCNTILKNMLKDIMLAIQESKADIQYTELPVIKGNATEIKLLFQNLVLNAIKFRKKDITPHIKISARKIPGLWEFSISDNGIGIEKKYGERIFNIFQRLHTRREYSGSGIGLSHCKKIVELHHGKIWVESIPGEGSTFYFVLPANESASAQVMPDDMKVKSAFPITENEPALPSMPSLAKWLAKHRW